MTDIKYITSDSDLEKLISDLGQTKKIAIDLEFDSNHHHYGFNLCLMQLFCGSSAYLVDPMKVDITLIFPFLENNTIQKVVFSFGEDLRLLHSLGCKPKNIYDISIAIKLLNYEKISLADALEINMNVQLEKGSQKSDWCRRPISEKQKIYAAHDVVYLFDLQKHIEKQAINKDISTWIEEENLKLENHILEDSGTNIIKKKDRYKMTEFQWFFYQKLWHIREEEAEKLDKPAHQVINNEFLKEIAFNPNLLRNWKTNKFIHHSIKTDSFGRILNQIYQRAEREAKEKNISKTSKEIKPLSAEEYRKTKTRKKETELLKEKIFRPIQKGIRRDYGEFAVNYIISNRQMEDVIEGRPILNYRKNLILKYAEEIGISLNKIKFQ